MKNDRTLFFAIKKPSGPTSHDIIDELRLITGIQTIGHAGTLDPFAEGVLVVGVGRESTKKLSVETAKDKEYIALVRLGAESDTYDRTGIIIEKIIADIPLRDRVKKILGEFIGLISQSPPLYSALKIKGEPYYKKARRGEKFVVVPRKVLIKDIKLIEYRYPYLKIKVVTGPGVYIRSLARDIGTILQTGGLLQELTRTRVGKHHLNNALDLEDFKKMWIEKYHNLKIN